MPTHDSHDVEAQRRVRRPESHTPESHVPHASSPNLSPVSRTLLGDPRLGGRGNAPVRAAMIQQMQQNQGNRATQRFLQQATKSESREDKHGISVDHPPRTIASYKAPRLQRQLLDLQLKSQTRAFEPIVYATGSVYIGNDDYLVALTAYDTNLLHSYWSYWQDVRGKFNCSLLKKFSPNLAALCNASKYMDQAQWLQVRWFIRTAAALGQSGVWINDGGRWFGRDNKIKPAQGPVAGVNTSIVAVRPGTWQRVNIKWGDSRRAWVRGA